MTQPADPSGLGRLLADTIAAAGRYQAARAEADEQAEGRGEAADGMVVVHAVPPGNVSRIELDPRVLRLGADQLVEALTEAVNAALADCRAKAGVATGTADFTALREQLGEIRERSLDQLSRFNNALAEAQDRLVRRAEGAT